MANFSLSEVFHMAEEIERNGHKFYREAVKTADHPDSREVFTKLAEQEKMHELLFASWRQEACADEEMDFVDMDGQAQTYLQSMASNHVFNLNKDVSKLLTSIQTPLSLITMAIGFENDTIKFFTSLKDHVISSTKAGLERLITEEQRHIQILNDLKLKLARK